MMNVVLREEVPPRRSHRWRGSLATWRRSALTCWLLALAAGTSALLSVSSTALAGAGSTVGGTRKTEGQWVAPELVSANRGGLPPAFFRSVPQSIEDLAAMQRHVQALIARVSPTVVAVQVGTDIGTGVVVSPDGMVLTAGHVCGSADRRVTFTFPDGKTARGKTVGLENDGDAGLMKITDPGPWPSASVGLVGKGAVGDWVLALGHPGGYDRRRSLVARLGRLIRVGEGSLQSDCTISAGDSGGPLFDMQGRVVGIHSAISRSMAENFHVPIARFYRAWSEISGVEATGSLSQTDTVQVESGGTLARGRFRNGEETLRAFEGISRITRQSVVRFNVEGEPVALGAVVDDGLAITKASEIKAGKLTCWLASEKEVRAEVLAVDEDEDVALVHVESGDLRPIQWDSRELAPGEWAVTPGIGETPHAVGIISALPRRIRPQRAFVGIQFQVSSPVPKIDALIPGLGAEQAGLRPGDTILAVNATAVTNREQVVETLRDFREGQSVKLRVRREGKELEADVRMMTPREGQIGGYSPERQVSRMTGRTSQRAEGFDLAIEHDTVLQPWLCGGPLVDLDGKAVGLNIARAARSATYALPAKLVAEVVQRLRAKAFTSAKPVGDS